MSFSLETGAEIRRGDTCRFPGEAVTFKVRQVSRQHGTGSYLRLFTQLGVVTITADGPMEISRN